MRHCSLSVTPQTPRWMYTRLPSPSGGLMFPLPVRLEYRRRLKTEEKAKVVAAVWGIVLIKFLAAIAILHQDDLNKGMSSSYSSYLLGAIHPILQIFLLQS